MHYVTFSLKYKVKWIAKHLLEMEGKHLFYSFYKLPNVL